MGSSCSCNCARTTPEPAEEEASPSAGGRAPKGAASSGALEEVRVPPGACGAAPAVARPRALHQGWREREPRGGGGTPRFDEAPRPAPGGGPEARGAPQPQRAAAEARGRGREPRDSPQPSARSDDDNEAAEVGYEGDYLDARRHGFGTLRMRACTYIGDFWHGAKHGKATLAWDDGREYRGQFRHGKFHGSATMIWPDGRKYSGQYADNQKHGNGIFMWQDGRSYEGQWLSGKRHGTGTYTNAKGLSCRGTWSMDRPLCWETEAADDEVSDAQVTNL